MSVAPPTKNEYKRASVSLPTPPPPKPAATPAVAEAKDSSPAVQSTTVATSTEWNYEQPKEEFFVTTSNEPTDVSAGLSRMQYDIAKGAITAPVLLITAPWVCAVEGAHDGELWQERTVNCIVGFGKGLLRGIVGAPCVIGSGLVYGGAQIGIGFSKNERPGEGTSITENYHHTMDTPFLHLCLNIPDEKWQDEEAKKNYSFFNSRNPENLVVGLRDLQYNTCKGVVAGTVLLFSASVYDCVNGSHANGVEGGVRGFGEGLTRGLIGGPAVMAAGATNGVIQFAKGFSALENVHNSAVGLDSIGVDIYRATREPIRDLVGLHAPTVSQ